MQPSLPIDSSLPFEKRIARGGVHGCGASEIAPGLIEDPDAVAFTLATAGPPG